MDWLRSGHRRLGRRCATSPSSSSSFGRLLVVLLLLPSLAPMAADAAPLAGGSGFARYFRGRGGAADLAAARVAWPSPEATVEFWVRVDDPTVKQVLFAYQSADDTGEGVRGFANALELIVEPTQLIVVHKSTAMIQGFYCTRSDSPELGNPSCSSHAFTEWTHVAMSLNVTEGNIKVYLNGTKEVDLLNDNRTAALGQFTMALRLPLPTSLGVLMLGQNPVDYMALYESDTQTNALMDQVRVWAAERSEQEIRNWMHIAAIPVDAGAGLVMDWRMDSFLETGEVIEPDLSGSGNNLYIGAIPQAAQSLQYYNGAKPSRPSIPPVVESTADVWGGPIGVVVRGSGEVSVTLRAKDDKDRSLVISITRLPASGLLYQASPTEGQLSLLSLNDTIFYGTAMYAPDNFDSLRNDTFEYTVTNDLGESSKAEVVLIKDNGDFPLQIVAVEISAEESGMEVLQFGGFNRHGEQASVVITQLPRLGKLYQLPATTSSVAGVVHDFAHPIVTVPEVIALRSGLIGYKSPGEEVMNTTQVVIDELTLAWEQEAFNWSYPITVGILVSPVNNAPTANSTNITVEEDVSNPIKFPASDPEGDDIYIKVLQLPKIGTLARSDGYPLTEEYMPVIAQHPSFLPPYSPEWGPSWSRQGSPCPCCIVQETCNMAGGAGTDETCPCQFTSYTVDNILGKPNAFPTAGINPLAFGTNDIGIYSIVVGINLPVHITSVKVYEILNPGKVTGIFAAAEYRGNQTEWTVLYEGPLESLPRNSIRAFSPSLCPSLKEAYKYLRLEVTVVDPADPIVMIDAIEVLGTIAPLPDLLLADRTALYTPLAGVHGAVEALHFKSLDCNSSPGNEKILYINVAEPTNLTLASSFGDDIELWAVRGEEEHLQFSIDNLLDLLPEHIPRDAHKSMALVTTEALGTTIKATPVSEEWAGSSQSGQVSTLPLEVPAFVVSDTGKTAASYIKPLKLQVWVTFESNATTSETFRLGVTVRWMCPVGSTASECALSAADCIVLEGGSWYYSQGTLVCRKSTFGMFVGLMVGLVIFLLLACLVGIFLLRRSHKRAKVLSEELQSLKVEDIEFLATIDAEAPISMVTTFLKELAKPPAADFSVQGLSHLGKQSSSKARALQRGYSRKANHLLQVLNTAQDIYTPTFELKTDGNIEGVGSDLTQNAMYLTQLLSRDANMADLTSNLAQQPSGGTRFAPGSGSGASTAYDDDRVDDIEKVKTICGQEATPSSVGTTLFFNTFAVQNACFLPLTIITVKAIRALEVDHILSASGTDKFIAYLLEIEYRYKDVPYHSNIHGGDVTARMAAILKFSGIAKQAKKKDNALFILSAIVAAAIHDAGHPGTSNSYHVQVQSSQARRYHDQSVLENHSLSIGLEMLSKIEFKFTEGWSYASRQELRRVMISLVLGTDFVYHFEHIGNFKSKVLPRSNGEDNLDFTALPVAEKLQVLTMALKVADIGHCAADWESHKSWVQSLEDEFFAQGDLEKKYKLPVSALMDRDKTGVGAPVSQISFFEALAIPLFKTWASAFPGCSGLLEQAESNLRVWKDKQTEG